MKIGPVVVDEKPAEALKIARTADRADVHSLWTIDYYNRSHANELQLIDVAANWA